MYSPLIARTGIKSNIDSRKTDIRLFGIMQPVANLEILKRWIKTGGLVGILRQFRSYGSRYAVVGASGTIIYVCLLKLLVEGFNRDPVISSALASIPSIIATYLANYFWTFQSSHDHLATLFRFVAISLVALLLNMGIMHLCVDVLGLWYLFGALITVVVVAVINFLLHVYWSFRLLEG